MKNKPTLTKEQEERLEDSELAYQSYTKPFYYSINVNATWEDLKDYIANEIFIATQQKNYEGKHVNGNFYLKQPDGRYYSVNTMSYLEEKLSFESQTTNDKARGKRCDVRKSMKIY